MAQMNTAHLKSLAFVAVPRQREVDPATNRRQRVVARLEEQILLAKNPEHTVKRVRRAKRDDGGRMLVEYERRPGAWWVTDASGQLVMTVRVGYRLVEFEKGKTGIAVGRGERLEAVIRTLMDAIRAGELDGPLAAASAVRRG